MVVHRVVGHVDHDVAQGGAGGQRGPDTGHALGRAVDDAIEIDEEEHAHDATVCACPRPPAPRPSTAPIASSSTAPTCSTASGRGRAGRPRPRRSSGGSAGRCPSTITIDLVFDGVGHGVYGRLAQKMVVRYSGRRAADDTILDLVSEATMHGGGPAAADRVLVVTNDRGLRDHLAAKGARTAPLQWFIGKLDVPAPVRDGHGLTPAGRSARAGPPARVPARRGTPRATRIARAGSRAAARPPSPGRRTRSPATSATRARRADRVRLGAGPTATAPLPGLGPVPRPSTCAGVTPPVSICA